MCFLVAVRAYGGIAQMLRHLRLGQNAGDVDHLSRHRAHLLGILGNDGSAVGTCPHPMLLFLRWIGCLGQFMPDMPFLAAAWPAGRLTQRAGAQSRLSGYRLLCGRNAGVGAVFLNLTATEFLYLSHEPCHFCLEALVLHYKMGVVTV